MTRPPFARATALAVLLISLAALTPARAAENLQMAVRPGFAGAAKAGTWVPIEVELQNTGAETVGEVRVQVEGQSNRGAWNRPPVSYTAPVTLPSRARKRVSIEAYLPSLDESLSVQYVAEGQTLAKQAVALEHVASTELFCGVMAGNRAALDFLSALDLGGPQRRVRLAHLDLVDVPTTPQVLQSLDCLIIANVSTGGLVERQKNAIQQWVASGGLLVLGGGASVQKTVGSLPASLLPVKVSGSVPVQSLSQLAAFAEHPLPERGPWLAGNAVATDGVTVVEQDGQPLLVAARRGLGAVVYLGLDPTAEPLRTWEGSELLWRHVLTYALAPTAAYSNVARPAFGWGRVPRSALSELAGAPRATSSWLIYLLFGYVLVVGPANYLALRRVGRLEWSLATIPLVTLLCAVVALAGARARPASDAVVNSVALLRSWDGESALARSYVAVFSLREQRPDLRLPEGSLVLPQFYPFPYDTSDRSQSSDWALDVRSGDQPGVESFALRPGTLGTITVDGSYRLPGRVAGRLFAGETVVRGEIVSHLARPLRSAALVVGGDVVRLGDLQPGEIKPVSLTLGDTSADTSDMADRLDPADAETPPEEETALRDVLQSALGATSAFGASMNLDAATLVGWIDDAPSGNPLHSSRATPLQRTLLVSSLALEPEPGLAMAVHSSLLHRRSLVAGGVAQVQGNSVSFSNGEAISWEYELPFDLSRFTVDELRLDLEGSVSVSGVPSQASLARLNAGRPATRGQDPSGASGPGSLAGLGTAHFYDWQHAEWVAVDLDFGENRLDNPQRFVSPLGLVRLRYLFRAPTAGLSSGGASASFRAFNLVIHGRST